MLSVRSKLDLPGAHKTATIFMAILLNAILCTWNTANAQDWSQLRQKVVHSVLYIETVQQNRDGTNKTTISSSGFVITKNGYGLTAAHAVPRETSDTQVRYFASVGSRYSHKFPIEVVQRIEELDIALLQFPNVEEWIPVEMGDSRNVPDDARLYVLGFPRSSDLSSAEGLLSNHFGPGGKWQTTLPLDYGNSGGPVFDIGGRVIGIAAGGYDNAHAITFVIPSSYTKPLQDIVEAAPASMFAAGESPSVPSGHEVMKAFAFAYSVDHQEKKNVEEDFCLPTGVKVSNFKPVVTSLAGKETKVYSFSVTPNKPNCVRLQGEVAGNGVDKVGSIIVNYRGRGWLTGHIDVVSGAN
jgi:S1-C subfamily serine protease